MIVERHPATLLTLFCLCLLLRQPARAGESPEQDPGSLRMSDVTAGRLLLPSSTPGRYQPLPTLHTDVHMRISGVVASVSVKQRFHNPGTAWVEGVYVFPLPERAALHRLRMHIGERVIDGVVQEKKLAQKTYRKARRAGKRASLVEQERPNIFTASVANIGPGEEVIIELEYNESVRYVDGRFRLRFPTVVGPRFIPGQAVTESVETSGRGWALDTDVVPDASRITPPVLPPGRGRINPLALTVELAAGVPLARIASSYHRMRFEQGADGVHFGRLEEPEYADRDFELSWIPELGHAPRAAAFLESRGGDTYALIVAMPPRETVVTPEIKARELILVIDTSGSMAGRSIAQAIPAAHYALKQLRSKDRFNIIQFNSMTGSLFDRPQPVTQHTLAAARHYLDRLQARGGTHMAPALRLALATGPEDAHVRQVVFMTDGAVGNERQLFDILRSQLGETRLFTVGIGSAPNSYFMRRAAEFGRGTHTYIGASEEVNEKMAVLFNKIRYPLLTDIRLDWNTGGAVETWPRTVPDLYAGEPVVVSARLRGGAPGNVVVSANLGDRPWRLRLPLQAGAGGRALSILWARNKIAGLMNQQLGGESSDDTRQRVIELGLMFNLVSRYTSLVAVDTTPVRPRDQSLVNRPLPTNLPHGWSYAHVFGALPRTASAAPWHLLLGVTLLTLALALLWWLRFGPRWFMPAV